MIALTHAANGYLAAVCGTYGVTKEDIIGRSRVARIATARHVLAWLIRDRLQWSFEDIGNALGGRDHSSIIYGVSKIQDRIDAGDRPLAMVLRDAGARESMEIVGACVPAGGIGDA